MLKKLVTALALAALVLVPAAFGDAVFHSTHAPLSPVGGAPLRSGFVQINHMDGPINFAHDNYVLNGAAPNATYTVMLHISTLSDTTCSAPFVCRARRDAGDERLGKRRSRRGVPTRSDRRAGDP